MLFFSSTSGLVSGFSDGTWVFVVFPLGVFSDGFGFLTAFCDFSTVSPSFEWWRFIGIGTWNISETRDNPSDGMRFENKKEFYLCCNF